MASRAIKFSSKLKELRIHLCQHSEASKGAREFVEKFYVPIKKSNPNFPILIRECAGIQPVLWARYEFEKVKKHLAVDYYKLVCFRHWTLHSTRKIYEEFSCNQDVVYDAATDGHIEHSQYLILN